MAKSPVFTSSLSLGDLQTAKREWSQRLLQAPRASGLRAMSAVPSSAPNQNVVGVGIGEKLVDNKPDGIMAVKFLVQVKYPESQMGSEEQLAKTINGLAVDGEQGGLVR